MGQLCSCSAPRKRKLKRERRLSDDASVTERTLHDDDDSDNKDDGGFSSDGDEIHIIIDGEDERDALLGGASAAVMTKRTSKSALLRAQTATAIGASAERGETASPADPCSAVEQRRAMDVLRSYQRATGVVDPGQAELECVMCLDTFGGDNPKVRTLCNCGVNRTNFHLSCLLEWLNRDANCPVCRQYLFYEEP